MKQLGAEYLLETKKKIGVFKNRWTVKIKFKLYSTAFFTSKTWKSYLVHFQHLAVICGVKPCEHFHLCNIRPYPFIWKKSVVDKPIITLLNMVYSALAQESSFYPKVLEPDTSSH